MRARNSIALWLVMASMCFGLAAAAQTNPAAPLPPPPVQANVTGDMAQTALASRVWIEKTDKGFQLMRNGQPYYIRGAGGTRFLDQLAAAGGNSVRSWSAEMISGLLDKALKNNLTVTIGLWMAHERHRFNYLSDEARARQLREAREDVQRYKNHPSLLAWGLGNEVEWIHGTNVLIYQAIEEMAQMVKKEDPNHPTMTTLAELGSNAFKVALLKQYCPSIDILGVNSFGSVQTLPERLKAAGWDKPYIVTEFGPPGPWEVPQTPWGAEIEPDTTKKSTIYLNGFNRGIASQPGWCLGSYAFYWGNKFECTPTWFSMFSKEGARFGPVDYMTYVWNGRFPTNRCPEILSYDSSLPASYVEPNKSVSIKARCTDPDGDALSYRWELFFEFKRRDADGLTYTELKPVANAGIKSAGNQVSFNTPAQEGAFRVFMYVFDGKGQAASFNIPFFVSKSGKSAAENYRR